MIRKRESDRNVLNGSSEDKRTSNKGVTTNVIPTKRNVIKYRSGQDEGVFVLNHMNYSVSLGLFAYDIPYPQREHSKNILRFVVNVVQLIKPKRYGMFM